MRLQILDRDQHICQIGLPGCRHEATQVDHIRPVLQAPWLELEPSNLRAACAACNLARRNGQSAALDRPSREW